MQNIIRPDPDIQQPFIQQLRSPLTLDQLCALQAQDDKCTTLTRMLENGKLDPVAYSLQEGILYRQVIEGGQSFQAIYVLKCLKALSNQYSKQHMTNQVTMDSRGHIQPSEGCITGKESKKTYFNIAEIATPANYTRLLQ